VHLFTHGIRDEANDASRLELNGGSALAPADLSLCDAEFIFLNPCHSGRGRASYSVGLSGFTHSLFYRSHCPSFITSLWANGTRASLAIVGHFYKILSSEPHVRKSVAFQRAISTYLGDLQQRKTSFWERLEYWACFNFYGLD